MITETLELNGTQYLVKIHYENRKNSSVSIRRTNINIRIPSFLNREEKARQLFSMKMWAKKKLLENPKRFKPESQKEYSDGDTLVICDEEYTLRIEFKDKRNSSARLQGRIIHLYISCNLSKKKQNDHISSLISRCIGRKRLPKLQRKIEELNKKHFKQKLGKIFFKYNKSNWGSCSHVGNINISTRLLFSPDDVLEYVCIHELAHLIVHNHSERFWALVAEAMPDYKTKKKWLKEKGDVCRF